MENIDNKVKEQKPVIIKINCLEDLKKKGYIILPDNTIILNRIDEVLVERKITPADLSKMSGIPRQNINAVMKGKMKPGIDFVLKISHVLGVTAEDLFSLTDDAWVQTAKSTEESTLYIDIIEMEIIDGKTKKERTMRDNIEFLDVVKNKPISSIKYDKLLSEYLDDNLEITVVEVTDEVNTTGKKVSDKVLESEAKKRLIAKFEEMYIKKYKKLAKKITPLVNPGKKSIK